MHLVSEYVSLLKQLHVFISTRMHVTILATAQGVPSLAISSQYKIKNYMSNIGCSYFSLLPDEISLLGERLRFLSENRNAISIKISTAIAAQIADSLDAFEKRLIATIGD